MSEISTGAGGVSLARPRSEPLRTRPGSEVGHHGGRGTCPVCAEGPPSRSAIAFGVLMLAYAAAVLLAVVVAAVWALASGVLT